MMSRLVIVALGLLQTAQCQQSFCDKKAKDCDEIWTPIPNLNSALVGYDLPTGNPLSGDFIEDPGLKGQIFQATQPREAKVGGFQLEAGITAREYSMCHDTFETKVVTNLQDFMEVLEKSSTVGSGFNIGIESDYGDYEGRRPPLNEMAWRQTDGHEQIQQFFKETSGAVAVSQVQCITHKVDINRFLTPKFHSAFVEVLQHLEKQEGEMKQKRAFRKFIHSYGTHYVSSVFMGAKAAATSFYTALEKVKNGRDKIIECSQLQAEKAFAEEGKKKDKTAKKKKGEEEVDEDANECIDPLERRSFDREMTTVFGMVPKDGNFAKWSEEKSFKPIPIRYELTPIVNLFTEENLDNRNNVNSTVILKWFLPLYLKYCKVFGMDCSLRTGCGYDDNCKFEEKCVKSKNSGYKCMVSSWSDVQNWPRTDLLAQARLDAEPPNITWFRSKDKDKSGDLTKDELWMKYAESNWYNQRFQTVVSKMLEEADMDENGKIDLTEYIKMHERHPWFGEQLTFMIVNTDSNDYLSKDELFEATKISPDMHSLNFGYKQLENLVDGLLAIGDKDKDGKITFGEYVLMSTDVFVDNFAPVSLKRFMQ